jgi:hypothetical protein
MIESAPMKDEELGHYVCVAPAGCLHAPKRDINADGVWVKAGQQWSSAHRDCYEASAGITHDRSGDPDYSEREDEGACRCGHPQIAHEVGVGICDDCECNAYQPERVSRDA